MRENTFWKVRNVDLDTMADLVARRGLVGTLDILAETVSTIADDVRDGPVDYIDRIKWADAWDFEVPKLLAFIDLAKERACHTEGKFA